MCFVQSHYKGYHKGGRPEGAGAGWWVAPRLKVVFRLHETPLWNTNPIKRIHRIKRINRKRCSGLQLGPYLPHAPGVRMTVVKTNSLKLNLFRQLRPSAKM